MQFSKHYDITQFLLDADITAMIYSITPHFELDWLQHIES
jgi:hypothetical protein